MCEVSVTSLLKKNELVVMFTCVQMKYSPLLRKRGAYLEFISLMSKKKNSKNTHHFQISSNQLTWEAQAIPNYCLGELHLPCRVPVSE
jgi:hypothetical protein